MLGAERLAQCFTFHKNVKITVGIGLYSIFVILLWEVPGVYAYMLGPVLKYLFGDFFADYFWSDFFGQVAFVCRAVLRRFLPSAEEDVFYIQHVSL